MLNVSGKLFMSFAQMLGGDGAPVFLERIGAGFALNGGDGFLNSLSRLVTPGNNGFRIDPISRRQFFFRNLQTVLTERGVFQFGVNVTRIIVLAVAAEPQKFGDDQLRSTPA